MREVTLQEEPASSYRGYLAHRKQRPPRTLQKDCAKGPMVILGGGVVSYERGTPVGRACLELQDYFAHKK
jgi:hypothetical protein